MDGYKTLNMPERLREYAAGLKGGPFNKTPYTPPPMTVVDAIDPSVKTAMGFGGPTSMSIQDPWINRRSNPST